MNLQILLSICTIFILNTRFTSAYKTAINKDSQTVRSQTPLNYAVNWKISKSKLHDIIVFFQSSADTSTAISAHAVTHDKQQLRAKQKQSCTSKHKQLAAFHTSSHLYYSYYINRVKWRHRIYRHDTIAILWVQHNIMWAVKSRRFIVLFKQIWIRGFKKMSIWSLIYTSISQSFTYIMAAKTSWHRYGTKTTDKVSLSAYV